ncbi:glycosyltransferase (plasmid) [Deinococcus sp. KNUC1210]|uniref:glycosyltransferase n=1 Tax=Deinococcus sp. KNUC1210 TaxID=2917691 RepID=UPI001EF144E5|nr:glycosyltransferase [Deinococcus sp. KNUC1210]ULH13894.1 glycosyltransferase [Deinococcus sp. KNUC1210]
MTPRSPDRRPLRVLHLTGTLDQGGIETWLMNLLTQIDRQDVAMDIMTVSGRPRAGIYDERAAGLGAHVIAGPAARNPLSFALGFLRLLRQHGPYDVVHSHIHHFGGLALLLARLCGVPVRMATSHIDSRLKDYQATGGRYWYLTAMRAAMQLSVTDRLAVSTEAAQALFGPDWQALGTQIMPLGIDLQAFTQPVDSWALRAELGLPAAEPVLAHVGQFRPEKNHRFLLEVFGAYVRRYGPAQLLLIGDGALRGDIEAQARQLGLEERIHLLGPRSDVAQLLLGAADVFVFPSLFEGLSLALLEAQSAGLPCVVASGLSEASRLQGAKYEAVPLDSGPDVWAAAISAALAGGRALPTNNPHDIVQGAETLRSVYLSASAGALH